MRSGKGRANAEHFTLRWMPTTGTGSRMGMAVSRKVSKRAVVRNTIKRITRESFRVVRSSMPPLDVLVIAKPTAAVAERDALRRDLDAAWRRLQALKLGAAPGTIGG